MPRRHKKHFHDGLPKDTALELPNPFDLSHEFLRYFQEIEEKGNHVYVTGRAGTGKSTFLKYFRLNTKKKIAVVAPTGIAAINVSGQTVHSFFRLPHQFIQKDQIKKVPGSRRIFSELETLIIDEVSMMRADLMDAVDYSLRLNKGKMNLPFGGVQIVLIGDLFQLPPIIDKLLAPHYGEFYETPYFFSAHIFKEASFSHLHFDKVYRQKDPIFMDLLNKIRDKTFELEDLAALNERVLPASEIEDCVTLTPTNAAAQTMNESRLSRLRGSEHFYEATLTGAFDAASYPTETSLRLKVGAHVLMIKNDPEKRWVNGSTGEVVSLDEQAIQVKIGDQKYDVEPVTWEKIKYSFDEETETIREEVVGSFEQFPMKLAWAITIHKSQGLTFDRVAVDLGRGAFTHGQVYVALSRCRSLEGLILKRPILARDVIFDSRISDWPLNEKKESLILRAAEDLF
ncbi:MAG: AAA family ATPase [Candidatus Omnitrophica bacterium]|nr:AAA family ATPase [Candidatus Omnitrophota bacterium]